LTLRRTLILTFALAALGAPAAQADYTKVVTANRFTVHRLTNATSCETGVGYRWANVPGERSASLKFIQDGREASLAGSPPYGNADPNYPAPAGLNQLFSETYFASAGDPNACEPVRTNVLERNFSATAQATLQIAGNPPATGVPPATGPSAACTRARKGLAKQKKAVKTLRGKYRKATRAKSRKRLKSRLGQAKQKQRSAAKAVRKRC
jgi:hypothetical protein